jgi:predicted nucleic acid-binding protein
MKTVFVDLSVLFSAVNSPTGGSSKLFILKGIKLKASKLVLTETERNVRGKLQEYHLERFFMLVNKIEILKQLPDDLLINKAKEVITEKDAVILAEGKHAKTNFLVTLDKKHFLNDKTSKFLKPQRILTPKMLIKMIEK